jgi:excisionase family DNA binding protein
MAIDLLDAIEPVAPTEAEAEVAGESAARLGRIVRPNRSLSISVPSEGQEMIELPAAAAALLLRLLTEMAQGHAMTLIPFHAELTTQNAADLLGVSRPFIIKQLDDNKIPHRMVGKHRRILFRDLMAYKRAMDTARHKALDDLAAESQKLGLE